MFTRVGEPGSFVSVAALLWRSSDNYIKRRFLFATLLVLSSSSMLAVAPLALKFIVDGFEGRDRNSLAIAAVVGLYILGQWLGRVTGELRTFVHGQADRRLYSALSDRLFTHIIHLPLRFHLDRQTGAINETLSNGLQGFQMVMQIAIYTLLPVIVQLATVAIVLLNINQPVFLALFMIALACYATAFTYGARHVLKAARGASTAQVEARGIMTDSILNYETVKYFTAESTVRDRLDGALNHTETEWLRFYKSRALNGVIVATIFTGFLGISILYAAREVMNGRMTVGDFVLINTYIIQLVTPLEQIGFAMQSLSQGYAFLEKMLEIFREKPEDIGTQNIDTRRNESHAAPPIEPSASHAVAGALTFNEVGVSYGADRRILTDVSFLVPPGKTLGIVGASGAGKSTMVRLLVRLIEANNGRILLDSCPISEMPLKELREAIAVVPQDTVLFNDTIGYNIAFGKKGANQEEIEEAARMAHLDQLVSRLPDGYDTKVGERGLKLSGGEKQRVSIARAALKRPRIYVFDEATSSLDTRTEQEILENLRELSKHATTLIIAHRLSTVVHADQIVVLDKGCIVERGTHTQLLQQNGKYAALWEAQQPRSTDDVTRAAG